MGWTRCGPASWPGSPKPSPSSGSRAPRSTDRKPHHPSGPVEPPRPAGGGIRDHWAILPGSAGPSPCGQVMAQAGPPLPPCRTWQDGGTMRRASSLALAALLTATVSPLAALPAAAVPAASPRFPTLPEDTAKTKTKLTADGRYIVALKPGRDVDKAKGKAERLGVKADKTYTYALKGYSAHLDKRQVAELEADPEVQEVVPDEVFHMTAQTRPTGVRRVNATES